MLSTSPYPELPGLQLVAPESGQLGGQVIYLDSDGENNVTFRGPAAFGPFDIPAFRAPEFPGQEANIMTAAADRLNGLFADTGVVFTLEVPAAVLPYSTVFVGDVFATPAGWPKLVGLAESVDIGNLRRDELAFVIAPHLDSNAGSVDEYAADLAGAIAHEVGHLLGYSHADAAGHHDDWEFASQAAIWGGEEGLLTFDTWDQGSSYLEDRPYSFNQFTPLDATNTNFATLTGCVATALAQTLYYWQYPSEVSFSDWPSSLGGHSYTYWDFDFWEGGLKLIHIDNAADVLDFPTFDSLNDELSTIHYDGAEREQRLLSFAAGVSVQMDYDRGSSGAAASRIVPAFLDTWGFGSARFASEWTSAIKSSVIQNIKDGMPVLIGLYGDVGGHRVILEGYNDQTDAFMINMGWGTGFGSYDGRWWDLGDPATGRPASVSAGYVFDRVANIVYDINPATGWAQAYGNAEHTGRSPYAAPRKLQDRWYVTPQHDNQRFQGLIVGQGGKIFALSSTTALNQGNSSYLFTIDPHGTKTGEAVVPTEFPIEGDARTYLAQGPDGSIYFASTQTLYRFNPKTSQLSELHSLPSGESFEDAVIVDDDGNLFLRSFERFSPYRSRVYSFTADGTPRWTYTLSSGREAFHDLALDTARNRLYVPYANLGVDTGLIVLDSTNASVLGSRSWSPVSSSSRAVKGPSIGPDGTVYVARYNELYALNPDSTLSTKWVQSTSPGVISHPPTVGRDHLYVAHWVSDTQYALTARSLDTGAVVWQFARNAGDYDTSSPIAVGANGVISYAFREKQPDQDASYTIYAIEDLGSDYAIRDTEPMGALGGDVVLGPESALYVIGADKITTFSDGTRGDAYSGGMGYVDNQAPAPAANTGVADGAVIDDDQVTLSWESSDPDGHGLTYTVYVGSVGELAEGQNPTGAMTAVATGLTSTSYTLTGLVSGRKYYWEVIASDGQTVTSSGRWTFTVTPTGTPDSIAGVKWRDMDGDGIRDAGEPSLPGWTVYLDRNKNGQWDTGELSTITALDDPNTPEDETGRYEFSNVPPGVYAVGEVVQPGWKQTYPIGDDSLEIAPSGTALFEGYKTGEGTPAPGGAVLSQADVFDGNPWISGGAYRYLDGWNHNPRVPPDQYDGVGETAWIPGGHAGLGTALAGINVLDADHPEWYAFDFAGYEYDHASFDNDPASSRYGHEDRWYDGGGQSWTLWDIRDPASPVSIASGTLGLLHLDIDYGLLDGDPDVRGSGVITVDSGSALYDELVARWGRPEFYLEMVTNEPPLQAENPFAPAEELWAIFGFAITLSPVRADTHVVLLDVGQAAVGKDFGNYTEASAGWRSVHSDLAGTNSYYPGSSVVTSTQLQSDGSITGQLRALTGDVDGDGRLETVVTTGTSLAAYDERLEPQFQVTMPNAGYVSLIADVNGDGVDDIGIGTGAGVGRVYFYDGDGTLLRTLQRTVGYDGSIWPVAVPAAGEILIGGGAGYSMDPRGLYLYDYATGNELWGYGLGFVYDFVSAADVDGDNLPEYTVGWSTTYNGHFVNGTSDYDLYLTVTDDDGSNLLTQIYPSPSDGYTAHVFTDLNQDGTKEILAIETHNSYYPGTSQVNLHRLDGSVAHFYDGPLNEWWSWAVADTDGDGLDNVVVGGQTTLALLNHELQPLAVIGEDGQVKLACDLTGDGFPEIVTLNSTGWLRVYDRQLALLDQVQVAGASVGTNVIASDVDADGVVELLVASETALQLFSFELPATDANRFVVNSAGDSGDADPADGLCDDGTGACTMRAALQQANASANLDGSPDVIAFEIPGAGGHTIQPASPLPTITDAVVIDATTQPGYAGAPLIELDGTNAGAGVHGLWIAAGNSTVRGLAVNRFGGSGIQVTTAGGNTIEGNYLGMNLAGTADRGNLNYGLRIAGSHGNTIGGTTAAARNLISGNDLSGILIVGANSNTILGNYIGTDVTGTSDRRNTLFGIVVSGASSGTTIGGTASGAGNVISGNGTAGIALSGVGVTNTLIQGNRIGTNPGGTGVVPNVTHGVQITDGSFGNTIGGTVAGSGNVISGNLSGIFLKGGGSNQVLGNRIGTDVTGSVDLGNRGNGIQIDSSSTGNTVGGLSAGAGNVISGNNAVGVALSGSGTQNNVVQGNWIGTSASGSADLGNTSFGVLISGAVNNVVGGTVSGAGNVISGNDNMGVVIAGATAAGNRLEGNAIGTDAAGNADLGNTLHGVQISGGASGTTIGGTASGAGNLISGNNGLGVLLTGSGTTGNLVQGNRIGTRLDGNAALGNSLHGVQISSSASGNVIGGTAVGAGNQISGNVQSGVFVSGAANNLVQGNLIGTDAAGGATLGNGLNGVQISNSLATGNTVGGSVAGAGNVISGNASVGLAISESASGNVVAGNRIGTDVSGTVDLGNGTFGVLLSTAFNNTLGGAASGAGNVISGNSSSGVAIQAGSGNTVQGNRIGTDVGGTVALANSLYGILLLSNTTGNTIGGTAAGEGNTIAYNGAGGVRVQNLSVNNAIRGNAIFNNVGVGLDLVGTGGMTPNDPGDPDAGPNRLQNFPVISSAVLSGGDLTITYVVDSATVNSSYPLLIDVYRADAAGQEGASYLATDTYAAAVAQTSRTVTLAVSGLSVNQRIVATATDAVGNTSEFSASVVVASSLLAPAEVQRESSSATLDAANLSPLVWQAIAAWESAGLDAAGVAALQSLSFEVADLPGRYLGWATRDRIVLDLDAAGYGWYVADARGEVSDEFEISDLKSQMDLLTAVMHEMGHALGLADLDGSDDLMAGVLRPGVRHLPTADDIDRVLANRDWLD